MKKYKYHMKKLLFLLLIYCSSISGQAQDSSQIVRLEPQVDNLYEVLEDMGIYIYRFDLSTFLNNLYTVYFYVDEYDKEKKTQRIATTKLDKNIRSLNELPEEVRDKVRKLKNISNDQYEWDNIKEIAFYISKKNDSIATFKVRIPGVSAVKKRVNLRPVGESKEYLYAPRPFKTTAIPSGDHMTIPLIMYGSYWLDTKHNIIRMCGEKEIDPQMKAEILQNMPHYFVVGVELEKIK